MQATSHTFTGDCSAANPGGRGIIPSEARGRRRFVVPSRPGAIIQKQADSAEIRGSKVSRALRARAAETILLVEDEDAVRSIARKILESFGYSVLDAEHSDRALAVVTATDGAIHLLLTDIVMPGMDGQKLAQRLLELRPETRVLFMSGYADSPERYVIDRRRFIQKPFTPIGLARKVREAIDAQDWS
jgi:CheY-like chemotaxis protein